ncbi:MAG: hypothetical protein A2X49_15165 [Lentisphaerae bacterium GWF2_52_8]|nr:MAG: hypothetical protein A2X49_15165 [Lentisphaerae bacterium GWF2_52_8]
METRFYDVYPKVVPADKTSTIHIVGRFPQKDFRKVDGVLDLGYVGGDGLLLDGTVPAWAEFGNLPDFKMDADGLISVQIFFRGEGEHTLRLSASKDTQRWTIADFKIYSLGPDLLSLRPFRGDMHMHSGYSACSVGKETPAYLAASCRRVGLDFMSIADHRNYQSSLEAVRALNTWPSDFRCYPAEEVHEVDSYKLHIINFGGRFSVCELMDKDNGAIYQRELSGYSAALNAEPDEKLRTIMAASDWCFDKIHEAGGLAIFCHPHWRPVERFHLPTRIKEYILKQNKYDAMEIVGHSAIGPPQREMNALSIAWWQKSCIEQGRMIPVVGNSDSHLCEEHLGHNATIVFAKSPDLPDLIAAIKEGRSVAGEFIAGEFPHLFGDFRLLAFSHFLLREFFPEHDEICAREGELMLGSLSGNSVAISRLDEFKGKIPALFKHYWGQ